MIQGLAYEVEIRKIYEKSRYDLLLELKIRKVLVLRAIFRHMVYGDSEFTVSRAILSSAGCKFAKIRIEKFNEKFFFLFDDSSEFNIWIRMSTVKTELKY